MTYASEEEIQEVYEKSAALISKIFKDAGVKSASGRPFGVLNDKAPIRTPSGELKYQRAIFAVMPVPPESWQEVIGNIQAAHEVKTSSISQTTVHICYRPNENSSECQHLRLYGPQAKL